MALDPLEAEAAPRAAVDDREPPLEQPPPPHSGTGGRAPSRSRGTVREAVRPHDECALAHEGRVASRWRGPEGLAPPRGRHGDRDAAAGRVGAGHRTGGDGVRARGARPAWGRGPPRPPFRGEIDLTLTTDPTTRTPRWRPPPAAVPQRPIRCRTTPPRRAGVPTWRRTAPLPTDRGPRRPDRAEPQRRLLARLGHRCAGPGARPGRRGLAPSPTWPRRSTRRAPIVIVNADTGERHPYWAELDSRAPDPAHQPPDRPAGPEPLRGPSLRRRHRGSSTAPGNPLLRPTCSRPTATACAPTCPASRTGWTTWRICSAPSDPRVRRSGLILAWDFTVASRRNLSERLRQSATTPSAASAIGSAGLHRSPGHVYLHEANLLIERQEDHPGTQLPDTPTASPARG